MRAVRWLLLGLSALPLAAAAPSHCACAGALLDCSSRERTSLLAQDTCDGATGINLSNNRLRAFPDGLPQRFVAVDVSFNQLTALPPPSQLNQRLQALRLAGNAIADAADELRALSALRELDVSANRLAALRFLPDPCALEELDASDNLIASLDGPLKDCVRLRSLSLSGNRLRLFPKGAFAALSQLRELILAENRLEDLRGGAFQGLHQLEYLDLRDNRLRTLRDGAFSGLTALSTLHLSSNPLRALSGRAFGGLAALEHLHLNDALVESLPQDLFGGTSRLRTLYLSGNRIKAVRDGQFEALGALEELHLQGNRLRELSRGALAGADSLQALHLERNLLEDVAPGAFRALARLQTLDLDGNRLRRLRDGALAGLRALRTLSLRYNRLEALPALGDCCARLRTAAFRHNNLSRADEADVRAALSRGADLDLRNNPLRPEGLRWALNAQDLRPEADERACACGRVRGGGGGEGGGVALLCVDAPCGGAGAADWVEAVRGAGAGVAARGFLPEAAARRRRAPPAVSVAVGVALRDSTRVLQNGENLLSDFV